MKQAGDWIGGTLATALILIPVAGELYWFWLAIKLESMRMAIIGIVPPGQLFAIPMGVWSMVFGPPDWMLELML